MSNVGHAVIAIVALATFFALLSFGASRTLAQRHDETVRAGKAQQRPAAPTGDAIQPFMDRAAPRQAEPVRPVPVKMP